MYKDVCETLQELLVRLVEMLRKTVFVDDGLEARLTDAGVEHLILGIEAEPVVGARGRDEAAAVLRINQGLTGGKARDMEGIR